MSIKVAIVEDEPDIMNWLFETIDMHADFSCVGSYGNCEKLIENIADIKPDVVVMDINLPGKNGIDCVAQLKPLYPDIQFIMCTVFEDADSIYESLKAGATGYILKNTSPARLYDALHDIYNGGSPMSAPIARKVVAAFSQPQHTNEARALLSGREQEVLSHLAKGYRYKEIADSLFISLETVRTHIRNIYEKLQVQSRTEAINKAYSRR